MSDSEFRVLWIDAAGEGRFTSVKAGTLAEAAWKVAIAAESTLAVFVDVEKIAPTGRAKP